MKCAKAQGLMMKFMDGELSTEEESLLYAHSENCPACKEEFACYKMMMEEFSVQAEVAAPDNLEIEIMAQVKMITPQYQVKKSKRHWEKWQFAAQFAAAFIGVMVLVTLYGPLTVEAVTGNDYLSDMFQGAQPYLNNVLLFSQDLRMALDQTVHDVSSFLYDIRNYAFAVLVSLMGLQYYSYTRHKNDAGKVA